MVDWGGYVERQRGSTEKRRPPRSGVPHDDSRVVYAGGAARQVLLLGEFFRALAALTSLNVKSDEGSIKTPPIRAGYLVVHREERLQEIEVVADHPEAAPIVAAKNLSGDPTQVVDAVELSINRLSRLLWSIQKCISAALIDETLGVIEAADDCSGFVDSRRGRAELGAGIIDFGESPAVAKKAVWAIWGSG